MSFADIAFVPYQTILPGMILSKDQMDADKYPMVKDWLHRMSQSQGIGKVIDLVSNEDGQGAYSYCGNAFAGCNGDCANA